MQTPRSSHTVPADTGASEHPHTETGHLASLLQASAWRRVGLALVVVATLWLALLAVMSTHG